MKRILILTVLILALAFPAMAADVVQTNNGYASYIHNPDIKTATFTITADGAGNVAIFTFYLYSVETKVAADDDVITVIIYNNSGATLFTTTTAAATTGEIDNADDRWPINAPPKIDVTGMTAAKIATVIVTFVR